MLTFEIDASARLDDDNVWDRRFYIVRAPSAIEAIEKVYAAMDKEFDEQADHNDIESLKRRDDIDAVL